MEVPKEIASNYDQVELLSDSGGMGVVYRCVKDGQTSAVKCVRTDPSDPTRIGRFRREIRILKALNHPQIIKINYCNEAEEPFWYDMEYAEYGDLGQLIPQIRGNVERVKYVFVQLCNALQFLHTNPTPVIHRDIKPQNILIVDNNLSIKITDVGLARFVSRDTVALTRTGQW